MKQRFSKRTRLVSGLLTAAMVCTFLPFSAFADSGVDGLGSRKILPHNFPNATFMEYVKRFDKDSDGFLDADEREAVKEIDVHAKSIDSLKGIEFFPNLEKLDCNNNKLTELDVSKNTKLTELYCMGNWQLSELDVSKNTALKILWCGSCNLSSLRLGANTELEALDCSRNQLSYLSTYNNSKLWYLDCSRNNLKSDSDLVISYNPNLKELRCGYNQLERLSVKKNTLLEKLYCNNNKLTYLDLESNSKLTASNVNVDGNAVPIKAGVVTRTFYLKDLPVGYRSSKTKNWQNGKLNGDILKVDPDATEVLYDFDCGNGITKTFALTVEWVPDGLKIDETNFPDEVFRNYLLNAKFYESTVKFDKDGNGFFSEEERNAITSIDPSDVYNEQKVASLKGIEHFPNLKILSCSHNNLSSLDVSKNEKLEHLYCGGNPLTSLDVSQNVALEYLWCDNNQLSSLDVSKNPALLKLWCDENNLTSLDVSKNAALEMLSCEQNNLTSLDVSQNHKLQKLYAKKNRLTSLDLSQTVVSTLYADDNQIDINVETTPRTFDLSTLPGFDASKATNWNGGTVDGGTLKVDAGATQVTYTYDCGNGRSIDFTLNVNVVPDSTVTPPSGGEGTGTTTPPSGGGTGTTTPPSGGGTGTTTPPSGGGTGTTTPPSGGEGTGTTTPPSGGEGTGTTTPPSGGGTGTTTPPSGGEGTGTTTPPSGGGTGTTTPPSGGGTGTTTPPSGGGTGTTTPPSGGGTGTTTPPSGGEGTGTTTPPSGGGTGTTTPPSGGGTGTTTPPSGGGTGTTTPPSGGEGTGTTTPPSGGEGTGTTTPPSGGGTGTTTPPSGGGTGTTTPPSGGGTGTTTPPSGGGTGTTTPPSGGGTGTTTPPSGGEGTGTTTPPSGGDGGGGAIVMVAGAAVAGVVGYGVYNYVSGQKLQALLPEGVAAPENRAQTALLLWNTAGRPEPAQTPAFADVADPDTAKAAQWCVEQGLMKRRLNGKFAPDSNIPAYQVLNAYRKLAG